MLRALIADDDHIGTAILSRALQNWQFEVNVAYDGESAWSLVLSHEPQLAIIDWEMPALDGPGLCRRIREDPARAHMHLIMLSSRTSREDVVAGLNAGADDYLVKPFDPAELRARLNVGVRVLNLQAKLAERVVELEAAVAAVKHLRGLIPICSYCKQIRSESNEWKQLEAYISEHSDAQFSHSICPTCMARVWPDVVTPGDTSAT